MNWNWQLGNHEKCVKNRNLERTPTRVKIPDLIFFVNPFYFSLGSKHFPGLGLSAAIYPHKKSVNFNSEYFWRYYVQLIKIMIVFKHT